MNRTLRLASGVASIAFGLFLVHRIGFVDGLFTAAPAWTPHSTPSRVRRQTSRDLADAPAPIEPLAHAIRCPAPPLVPRERTRSAVAQRRAIRTTCSSRS